MCDSWVYDEVNQNDLWIHGDSEHGSAHRSSLSDGCQSTFLMRKDYTYPWVSSVVSKFTSDCMALKSQCTSMKTDHELWWEVRKRQAEKEGESKRGRNEVFGHSGRGSWNKVSHCVLGRASAVYLPGHRTDDCTCRETQHHIALELTPRGAVKVLSSHSPPHLSIFLFINSIIIDIDETDEHLKVVIAK